MIATMCVVWCVVHMYNVCCTVCTVPHILCRYPEHMLQIMNKILQLRPLIQSKLDESIEAGREICKVVVEFATANRSFLSNVACSLDGDDIQLDGIKSGVEAQQTDALDVMLLVLVGGWSSSAVCMCLWSWLVSSPGVHIPSWILHC